MDHGTLYHLVPRDAWNQYKSMNEPYFPPTYVQDGFIHLTKEPSNLLAVANHFYTEVPGDFVVLAIDSTKLTGEVKFEPAADVGHKPSAGLAVDTQLFPHLYGSIDFECVQQELAVQRSEDGKFLSIEGI
mmetsp:Transcript_7795/g.14734  ORF Transcript_7795/g.14734 Transcript_7795/m.14734 type:complete len:130 (+) Transcript_7795:88-477(+)|eukprot:CAMPEP_0114256424 /NCGR_PEP_ID=MMETSP0058-20121206/18143_1 /TAXON_ID=36894 /ORGANISM="Pyramimonas parkeae, CCMP726" /LENGTH=129 /DNA_ID=CAMNT_0001370985 /DNA_START=81 /DNA_END=470 /DNA_ORIENTATION=+